METLSNLECFVRAADSASFSGAARRLGLTPAAVSRNVAMLEKNLGVRLFQRSTRRLSLTEAGEQLLAGIGGNLDALHSAIAAISTGQAEPSGILKVSLPPTLGVDYVLPLLPAFLARYPRIRPEWHFENRPADLVGEGYDAAIGGGFSLTPGMVARALAPAHVVAVAAPAYLAGRPLPDHPRMLGEFDLIGMRPLQSGRMRSWTMRKRAGEEEAVEAAAAVVLSDPNAIRTAALLGVGVGLLAVCDVLPALEDGRLVRLLPDWYADNGMISLYYPSRAQMPAKTRAFIDFVAAAFSEAGLARRFSALDPPAPPAGPGPA
jgi:DNA-binding transcriptional LysR family regulator